MFDGTQKILVISFSLHHSKKADSHSEDKASYTNVNARTALLNCLPVIIWSTVQEILKIFQCL
jgi:hypothetical protein